MTEPEVVSVTYWESGKRTVLVKCSCGQLHTVDGLETVAQLDCGAVVLVPDWCGFGPRETAEQRLMRRGPKDD